jgi:hypothetical protein
MLAFGFFTTDTKEGGTMTLLHVDDSMRKELVSCAREFLHADLPYQWTHRERQALRPFSNTNGRVFFILHMPTTTSTSLLSMFSRMKNARGLRGHWVDNVLPAQLAQFVPECAAELAAAEAQGGSEAEKEDRLTKTIQKWLKDRALTTLDAFVEYSTTTRRLFEAFVGVLSGRGFLRRLANSKRIMAFLKMWLDAYGHNSIARTGWLIMCVEGVSLLTVKTMEWTRLGYGAIEPSSRFLDCSTRGTFPIHHQLELFSGIAARAAYLHVQQCLEMYTRFMGEKTDGPLPNFYREHWNGIVPASDMEQGVFGESCDVLGNFLPCTMLTSVGFGASGEAFSQVVKHLYLDATPENIALADLIRAEADRVGAGVFLKHCEPTPWEVNNWRYLAPTRPIVPMVLPTNLYAESMLCLQFQEAPTHASASFARVLDKVTVVPRGEFDKLPGEFESIDVAYWSVMSFRGWRDNQRQQLCAHKRSLVSPHLGFYAYPKPAPEALRAAFSGVHAAGQAVYELLQGIGVPAIMRQYPLAMGNMVSYSMSGNLRQWEFCNWQRTKPAVNDEVRVEFLLADHHIRNAYPWWSRLSRADAQKNKAHYVFARWPKGGTPIVMP